MPGENIAGERFNDPLPPNAAPRTVRPPSNDPDNILEQNNDATGGTELAADVPDTD